MVLSDWVGDIQQCVQGEGSSDGAGGGAEEGSDGERAVGGERSVHGSGDRTAPPTRPPQRRPP